MRPGGLFFAVRGERRDGHDFVADAFANGARAALVARIPDNLVTAVDEGTVAVMDFRSRSRPEAGAPRPSPGSRQPLLLLVDEPVQALQGCAAWWRRRHRARVLAVAGSVGKTTTKELLANILEQRFRVLRTAGNFNNELGLPITLLQLTPEHDKVALEIGISHVGEMEAFAAVAGPDVAVITRIAPEHMEFLHDLDTVEREEGRLVEALPAQGLAVLNADDERVARMARRTAARVVTYGETPAAEVRATRVEGHGLDGLTFELHVGSPDQVDDAGDGRPRQAAADQAGQRVGAASGDGHGLPVRLPLVGRHFVTAALAAAGAALQEGCSRDDVAAGLQRPLQARRLAPRTLGSRITLLDDSYNAGPDSARAALDVLANVEGRRVAVLGDMLELGEFAPAAHREVGAYVPGRAHVLLTVGPLARETARAAREAGLPPDRVIECGTAKEAISSVRHTLQAGDTILVKGSHGVRLETLVEALVQAFPATG
ncbi:MAG TPA: UDP-N-acetylmuramoyl-tripeptide--D-alanyl-D-alanine ligase [Chloroflexota bacterium]|nr:UDP-N-acetylmuramoyl-tripeptide--D-alanyl-D-alanine ligase [Chloroflexota bacterium]